MHNRLFLKFNSGQKTRMYYNYSITVLYILLLGVLPLPSPAKVQNTPLQRPNILWLTSEDNSTFWVGCYGNPHAQTPNIDRLASEGFQYMNAFANAPVCAPSRSTWITGMYAVGLGTHPMRSRYNIPHDQIRYYPDYLRAAGYYCANRNKTDYNIGGRDDFDCWDAKDSNWERLKNRQPFFQIINMKASHESKAQGDVEHTLHRPEDTDLRAYHPDLPDIRKNYAKYYDAIKTMDDLVGEYIQKLENAGLADSTIVIYCSDHGGVLPRSKRFLFDSGLHSPLIIRIPEKFKKLWPADQPGSQIDRLISFIDMPKTWLSLAETERPSTMQGRVFLGPDIEPEPEFHYAFRGRMDERIDNVRVVRSKRFLYIKNYMPYVPAGQKLDYLWKMAATRTWDNAFHNGETDAVTSRFFLPREFSEELYDTEADPDNIHNLINHPEHAQTVERMRKALRDWQLSIHDAGLLPESEMHRLAEQNEMTVYEFSGRPDLYNLSAYLTAADLALEADPANLPRLTRWLQDEDPGLRYWGAAGLLMLDQQAAPVKDLLIDALSDNSHEVRILSAWSLFKLGEKERCYTCLNNLLNNDSYAALTVLNALDWMGPDADKPLVKTIRKYRPKSMPNFMKKEVLRMRQQLLEEQL